jgi:hypothetical protein
VATAIRHDGDELVAAEGEVGGPPGDVGYVDAPVLPGWPQDGSGR